jgi:superoxide reductase
MSPVKQCVWSGAGTNALNDAFFNGIQKRSHNGQTYVFEDGRYRFHCNRHHRDGGVRGGFFPDQGRPISLYRVNRVKDQARKTPLEKSHAPAISAPASVKAGEPFPVEISVGEILHVMGPTHWIEYIELAIGNEPAGRIDLQSNGYLKPKGTFLVTLPKEAAPSGKVTLVATQRCNLHGYWESSMDISVS